MYLKYLILYKNKIIKYVGTYKYKMQCLFILFKIIIIILCNKYIGNNNIGLT